MFAKNKFTWDMPDDWTLDEDFFAKSAKKPEGDHPRKMIKPEALAKYGGDSRFAWMMGMPDSVVNAYMRGLACSFGVPNCSKPSMFAKSK